ncbi:MAG: response regulator [Myxococcota bacterium]
MSARILLVEDNPSDEKLTLRAFAKHRGTDQIVVAHDGVEALEYLFGTGAWEGRDTTQQPALVLLDLKLPRLDGLELLRAVRADVRTRLVPIVVLTASNEVQDVARCYALGANAYVRKPIDFIEFGETARTIAQFWLRLNEAATPGGAP